MMIMMTKGRRGGGQLRENNLRLIVEVTMMRIMITHPQKRNIHLVYQILQKRTMPEMEMRMMIQRRITLIMSGER